LALGNIEPEEIFTPVIVPTFHEAGPTASPEVLTRRHENTKVTEGWNATLRVIEERSMQMDRTLSIRDLSLDSPGASPSSGRPSETSPTTDAASITTVGCENPCSSALDGLFRQISGQYPICEFDLPSATWKVINNRPNTFATIIFVQTNLSLRLCGP
jgi:hypothetical protein